MDFGGAPPQRLLIAIPYAIAVTFYLIVAGIVIMASISAAYQALNTFTITQSS